MAFEQGDRVICTETFGAFGGAYKGDKGVIVEKTWSKIWVQFENAGKRETPEKCIAKA
jgi:hypothetical protein